MIGQTELVNRIDKRCSENQETEENQVNSVNSQEEKPFARLSVVELTEGWNY